MVITMPQLGETVTEGTIVQWHKAVGDEVAEDDVLFDVSTDKVDSEVPSPAAGILREILVQEGETVAGRHRARGGRARRRPRPRRLPPPAVPDPRPYRRPSGSDPVAPATSRAGPRSSHPRSSSGPGRA